MASKNFWSAALLIALIGGGWWVSRQSETVSTSPDPAPSPAATASACREVMFEGSSFTVCPAKRKHSSVSLHLEARDGKMLRSLAALKQEMSRAGRAPLFAMNAGMYDDKGAPIGLYVADGKARRGLNLKAGGGNFHLKPNGVFWVDRDGRFHIAVSEAYAAQKPAPKPVIATQSGPMLLIGGKLHPKFSDDGPSRYRRNGVGIDKDGTAWFAISNAPVSFGKFARLFRDELACADALYFDGGVSALWVPDQNRLDLGAAIGPILMVERRP